MKIVILQNGTFLQKSQCSVFRKRRFVGVDISALFQISTSHHSVTIKIIIKINKIVQNKKKKNTVNLSARTQGYYYDYITEIYYQLQLPYLCDSSTIQTVSWCAPLPQV